MEDFDNNTDDLINNHQQGFHPHNEISSDTSFSNNIRNDSIDDSDKEWDATLTLIQNSATDAVSLLDKDMTMKDAMRFGFKAIIASATVAAMGGLLVGKAVYNTINMITGDQGNAIQLIPYIAGTVAGIATFTTIIGTATTITLCTTAASMIWVLLSGKLAQ